MARISKKRLAELEALNKENQERCERERNIKKAYYAIVENIAEHIKKSDDGKKILEEYRTRPAWGDDMIIYIPVRVQWSFNIVDRSRYLSWDDPNYDVVDFRPYGDVRGEYQNDSHVNDAILMETPEFKKFLNDSNIFLDAMRPVVQKVSERCNIGFTDKLFADVVSYILHHKSEGE